MSENPSWRLWDSALSDVAVHRRELILYRYAANRRVPVEQIIPLLQAQNIKPGIQELRGVGESRPWHELTKAERYHAIFLILTNETHAPKGEEHRRIDATPLKQRREWLIRGVPVKSARAVIQLFQLSLVHRHEKKKAARRKPKPTRGNDGRFQKRSPLFGKNGLTRIRRDRL